jgi:peptidoglycan hydrolase-like protein with peptidoglycan-binding domain
VVDPGATDGDPDEPSAEDPPSGDDEQPDGTPDRPADASSEGDVADAPQGADVEGDGTTGSSTATLTELLAVGETASRGSVLYRADDEPIVALLSATPLFRDLQTGVTDGPDVAAIESELRELGYGGFTVDEHFDSATAAAVRGWEEDLGRSDPDGVVTVGEVQLLDEPTAVLEHQVAVGDLLEPGDAVMVLGAESRVVEADIDADEVVDWAVGTALEVEWADGTTSTASVVEVGRDVADGQIDLVIALADGAGSEVPIGTRVDLLRTVAERASAVAVPVSAIVEGDEGPAVRVVADGDDREVDVELGIVDDGWVEIASGLEAGTEVRLPA